MKYRYDGPYKVYFTAAGVWVEPGEEFESRVEINHPHITRVRRPEKADKPVKETTHGSD